MVRTVPTSIRLREAELEELRGAAAFSSISISDVARRAIVAYLGLSPPDIRRADQAAAIVELGLARADLARLGNLTKLAIDRGRPLPAGLAEETTAAIEHLTVVASALIGHADP